MKTNLECIPCLQRQVVEAIRMATDEESEQERALREVMRALERMDWRENQLSIAKKVHGIVLQEFGDPYIRVKEEGNRIALALYPEIKRIIEGSEDKIATAIKMSIAGNVMDFGPERRIDVNDAINRALTTKLDEETYKSFLKDLESSDKVLFFADNCGEIVFDKPLLELLNRRVRFVVKKRPILNDAMAKDAIEVGISNMPNIELLEMETGENERLLEERSLVISKGQGNYEALSEHKGVYFLLVAKCPLIAECLGVDVGSIVFSREIRGQYT